MIQVVLEDDGAWRGYDHARYYREIVARFGDLPAIYFNFCEEHNERYSLDEGLQFMELLGQIDPYRHARAIHNVSTPIDAYLDSPHVQATSIQTAQRSPQTLNQIAVDWWQACLARNRRPLVVSFDEGRPATDRRSWWSVYMGGGIWESFIKVEKGYASVEPLWSELARTRAFMKDLPVEQMFPANRLVRSGKAFCLAAPGKVYALFLPEGGSIEVELTPGNKYRAKWFDPRTIVPTPWKLADVRPDGRISAPDGNDWALLIQRTSGNAKPTPSAISAKLMSMLGRPVSIRLAAFDASDASDYQIVTPPRHGRITGAGADRVYTPEAGFTGWDQFQWRMGASNVATTEIYSNATGVNSPPRAENQAIEVASGQSKSFILSHTDEDGPGPYEFRINQKPLHGILTGVDNDVTYTPAPGFTGEDTIRWRVSDGKALSNAATVRIRVSEGYFPPPDTAGGWRTRSAPNPHKLDEVFDYTKTTSKHGGLLVLHQGWLVYERYFGRGHRNAVPTMASCGKSVTSAAVGILIAEHPDLFPNGLDQKVFTPRYLPREVFPLRDPRMTDITVGQLLSMTAGIPGHPAYVHGKEVILDPRGPDGWQANLDSTAIGLKLWCKPGEGYSYATSSIHLASMVVRHVAGMELQEFVHRRLAEPLGFGQWGWGYRRPELTHTPGGGGIALRPTDMLRFAYMMLRDGQWGNRQLVPAEFVRACGGPSKDNPHYPLSLSFEVNGDGHVSGVPTDAFWKHGSGGHCFYVIPSMDLVMLKLGGRDDQYDAAQTGLTPAPFHYDGSRDDWKPGTDARVAALKTLQMAVSAIHATQ